MSEQAWNLFHAFSVSPEKPLKLFLTKVHLWGDVGNKRDCSIAGSYAAFRSTVALINSLCKCWDTFSPDFCCTCNSCPLNVELLSHLFLRNALNRGQSFRLS